MRPAPSILRTALLSATLAIALPSVVMAGQNDRAQAAIAEARGKISAGNMVGGNVEANSLQTRAKASLNSAEALLSKGKKTEAIAAAQDASLLADQAIAMTSSNKAAAAETAVGNAEAATAAAQQSAAMSAQDAAAANARADLAAAAPAPQTTPQTTTTTVETAPMVVAPTPKVAKQKTTTRVVIKKPIPATQSTTVTTTTPN